MLKNQIAIGITVSMKIFNFNLMDCMNLMHVCITWHYSYCLAIYVYVYYLGDFLQKAIVVTKVCVYT